jgi:2-dehydropantoate 2-reductase
MKVAIYGAGSIGTVLGAYFAKNGIEVDLITRNKNHVTGLKEKGAQIIGTINMVVPVNAFLPEEVSSKYDIIFLLTKQLDNKETVRKIVPFLKIDGVVCILQNGLPEISVAEVIGEDKTFGCSIAWGATLIGNGICELTSETDSLSFGLGTFKSNTNKTKLNEIKEILELMGPVEIESNLIGARWSKLLVNCAFSGMSAVLGCTFGEVAKNRRSRICVQKIIKECIDVAYAANIVMEPIQGKDIIKLMDYKTRLKKRISFEIIPLVIRKHKRLKASMLQDLEKGKKSEIDAINGIVREYGEKYGAPTPYNNMVINVIHDIENGICKPDITNLQSFDGLK